MRTGPRFQPRTLILLGIIIDLLLIGGRVVLYSPLWSQRGALVYVLEPVALLLVYTVITVWVTADRADVGRETFFYGSVMGSVTGGMWIVNLALETFADLSAFGPAATAPFLLGGFALWSFAAFRTTWLTGSVPSGILAAVWSAMTCVLMTIAFGLVLTYVSLPQLQHDLVTDPDFLRSHWRDLRAFAIANSFDSAFSHLLGGLLVGTVVGTAGGLLGLFVRQRLTSVSPEAPYHGK